MDDDWDLHAVVRGCSATGTTTSTVAAADAASHHSDPSSIPFFIDENSFDFPTGLTDDRSNDPFLSLHQIFRDFCFETSPSSAANIDPPAARTSIPAAQIFQTHQRNTHIQTEPPQINMHIREENIDFKNPGLGSSSSSSSHGFPAVTSSQQPTRQRKKKNQQMKIVRQMTQEDLSADSWAWRKYGQKPIKGSPYPRNYYRCSTSKGCAARKQVERSPTEPGIFVVSYTGEHTHPRPTHRSSLAGSTRNKFSPTGTKSNNSGRLLQNSSRSSSSPASGSSFSPTTPIVEGEAAAQNEYVEAAEEEEEDEEEEGGGGRDEDEENNTVKPNDLILNDDEDIFKGFQNSDHSSGGREDLFSGGLLSPPWNHTSSAANFGGGDAG